MFVTIRSVTHTHETCGCSALELARDSPQDAAEQSCLGAGSPELYVLMLQDLRGRERKKKKKNRAVKLY